ncbi:hypothetical protein K1719_008360 [Acacia pycnantha]|nr:hypothetical protein K1719_008360 [Acacia pycnantha]
MAAAQPVNISAAGAIAGVATAQENIQKVEAIRARCVELGMVLADWGYDDVRRQGFMIKSFEKLAKSVTSLRDAEAQNELASEALRQRSVQNIQRFRFEDFCNFAKWLKSGAGRTAASDLAVRQRVARRAGNAANIPAVSLVSLFEAGHSEYCQRIKEIRNVNERRIEDLKRQLREARALMEHEINMSKNEFLPFSEYEEPAVEDVMRDAFRNHQ